MKANRLKGLSVKRVDLVDQGASYDPESGAGSRVVLYKRDGTCPRCKAKVGPMDVHCGSCGQKQPKVPPGPTFLKDEEADELRRKRKKLKRRMRKLRRKLKRAKKARKRAEAAAVEPEREPTEKRTRVWTSVDDTRARVAARSRAVAKSLPELRAAAEAEERESPNSQAIAKRIAEAAAEDYPVLDQKVALQKYLAARPYEYQSYRDSFKTPTSARRAFVDALIMDELAPLTAALEQDGLSESEAVAKALSITPAIGSVRKNLLDSAAGASVEELEQGHAERGDMISKLVESVRDVVRKHAAGPEGKRITNGAAIAKLLKSRPGLAHEVATGDTSLRDVDVSKFTGPGGREAYEAYRQRSYAGRVGAR